MDTKMEDRELAETMIILTGESAHDAAVQFAVDCRQLGNEVLAELWERVVASIVALTRVAESVVVAAERSEAEQDSRRALRKCRIEHLAYDHVASAPIASGHAVYE